MEGYSSEQSDSTQVTVPSQMCTDEPQVEICARPADLPGASLIGGEHWWLRTPDGHEAGMGADDDAYYSGSTEITDHTGQGDGDDAYCLPAAEVDERWQNVDPGCVSDALEAGGETGVWIPGLNDCHDVVEDILDGCDPDNL